MSVVKVGWEMSKVGINAQFLATGKLPQSSQSIEINCEALTPDQRAVMLPYLAPLSALRLRAPWAPPTPENRNYSEYYGPTLEFDAAPDVETAIGILSVMSAGRALYEESERQRKADQAAIDEKNRAARLRMDEERERVENENRAAMEAKRAAALADKLAWIESRGSDHLRRGVARGHDCQSLYVVERAAVEAPGFVADFYDNAKWKDRACPSVKALDLADQIERAKIGTIEIVWLTSPAQDRRADEYYGDDFQPREAVVVRDYLGKYDLVKAL